MSVRRPSRRHAGLIAGLATTALLLAACSSGSDEAGCRRARRGLRRRRRARRRRRPDVRHRQRPHLAQPGRHRLGQRHPVRDPPARRLPALAGPGRRLAQAVARHEVGGQRRLDAVHVHPARRRHLLRRHAVHRRLREGELRRHRRGRRQELGRTRASSATPARRSSTRPTVTVAFTAPNAAFPQATSTVALGFLADSTLAIPFDDRASGDGRRRHRSVHAGPLHQGHRDGADRPRRLRVGPRRPREHRQGRTWTASRSR